MSAKNFNATFTYMQICDTELGLDLCNNVLTVFFFVFGLFLKVFQNC